jgi:hypothetical protein
MATRKANPNAIVNMVATATAKASATMAKAEAVAADKIGAYVLEELHKAHELTTAAGKKAEGMIRVAFNKAIDAGRKAKKEGGELKDLLNDTVDEAVELGYLSASTARSYKTSLSFAIDRKVEWYSGLSGAEEQEAALTAANLKVPKDVAKKAEAARNKRAEKAAAAAGAKAPKARDCSKPAILKRLKEAYEDALAGGFAGLAFNIKDAIHSEEPEWVAPSAK